VTSDVVCHHDLFPDNVLVDRSGRVAALLDWGYTMLAPREHDLFASLCGPDPVRFLRAYGAQLLDLTRPVALGHPHRVGVA
jgi:aminoglycoside phosphotransferase (APT) family kinase protein